MSRQISVRLPDEMAEAIDVRAKRSGRTKSEVVRDALRIAGLRAAKRLDPKTIGSLLEQAAELRARQPEQTNVVALLHEARGASLRLRLRRLTVPFMAVDMT